MSNFILGFLCGGGTVIISAAIIALVAIWRTE
jgi:hypothetical protein